MKHFHLWLTMGLITVVSPSLAQETETTDTGRGESSASGVQGAPDVVLLKDGSMVRGTIAEKGSSQVIILTLTGETRTYPMGQVEYAGPDSERATRPTSEVLGSEERPRPYATVHARPVGLQFRSMPSGVILHAHSGSGRAVGRGFTSSGQATTVVSSIDSYSSLCTAPCTLTLPSGSHRLALSLDKGQPVEPENSVVLDRDSYLEGEYTSNSGYRMAGLGVLIGSLIGSSYLVWSSLRKTEVCEPSSTGGSEYCHKDMDLDSTRLIGGVALGVGGGILGWVLLSISDKATISVAPITSEAPQGSHGLDRSSMAKDALLPRGAAFYGQF